MDFDSDARRASERGRSILKYVTEEERIFDEVICRKDEQKVKQERA